VYNGLGFNPWVVHIDSLKVMIDLVEVGVGLGVGLG
jgi:hypothetical protein